MRGGETNRRGRSVEEAHGDMARNEQLATGNRTFGEEEMGQEGGRTSSGEWERFRKDKEWEERF